MGRAGVAVLASAAALLAASISCATFDYPEGACHGSALLSTETSTKDDCAACVESRCCDAVGRCEDDGPSCLDPVHAMYACVIDGGPKPSVEARCGPSLGDDDHARSTYACMRDSCGDRCQLPACRVDPAAALIGNAACDKCYSDSCCTELNACYGNRACKLTVECITHCGADLNLGLSNPDKQAALTTDIDQTPMCTKNAPPDFPNLPCVADCIRQFGADDPTAVLDPHHGSICLATKILVCGIRNDCSESCAIPPASDAGTDAGDGG